MTDEHELTPETEPRRGSSAADEPDRGSADPVEAGGAHGTALSAEEGRLDGTEDETGTHGTDGEAGSGEEDGTDRRDQDIVGPDAEPKSAGAGRLRDRLKAWLQVRTERPDDPRRDIRRRTTRIFYAVMITLTLVGFGIFRAFVSDPPDGRRVITDDRFVKTANTLCRDTLPSLRPPPTTKDQVINPQETGDNAAKAAGGITRLAIQLGALPLEDPAQDQARRDWLADWKLYAFAGSRYADLMKAGRVADAQRVAPAGDTAYRRADRFARANRIDSCQFFVLLERPGNR